MCFKWLFLCLTNLKEDICFWYATKESVSQFVYIYNHARLVLIWYFLRNDCEYRFICEWLRLEGISGCHLVAHFLLGQSPVELLVRTMSRWLWVSISKDEEGSSERNWQRRGLGKHNKGNISVSFRLTV